MDTFDKLPLKSKKWIAAMIWTSLWMFLIWYGIKSKIDSSSLTAMVYAGGMIQSLYLGGQAAVDAFVRRGALKNGNIGTEEG